MDLFGRKKKEEEKRDEEFQEGVALTEEGRQDTMSAEYMRGLGHSIYVVYDPDVAASFDEAEKPAFSHLNRTTNIGKKEAALLELDYKYFSLVGMINMDEDTYDAKGWKRSIGLDIHARAIISDAFHGWKGKLLAEYRKIIRVELEKGKKGDRR